MSYNQSAAYNRLHIFNNDMTLKLKASIRSEENENTLCIDFIDLSGNSFSIQVNHKSWFNEYEEIAYSDVESIGFLNESNIVYYPIKNKGDYNNEYYKILFSTIEYLIEEKLHGDFQAKGHEEIAQNAEDQYEFKMNGGW